MKSIANAHGHSDHTCGNGIVKEKFHVPILIHEFDAQMLGETGKKIAGFFGFYDSSPSADVLLHDEDLVKFGKTTLKVIQTPRHSSGSISLLGTRKSLQATPGFRVLLEELIFQKAPNVT
jgi:glyoxylase-like metal-dependent hydrolase (beta-lactamase superfamily II)